MWSSIFTVPDKLRKPVRGLTVLFGILIVLRIAPEVLLWPYHQRIGQIEVYTEQPLPKDIAQTVHSAVALRNSSPLAGALPAHRVFLTDGGVRWALLAIGQRNAFAISIPFSEAIIVNRTMFDRNEIWTGSDIGRVRPIDRVLAHEMMHAVLRQRFGHMALMFKPTWLVEGYCDYVARNSSLSDQDYRRIKANGELHPSLPYYEGRQRITHMIEREGLSVEEIFSRY